MLYKEHEQDLEVNACTGVCLRKGGEESRRQLNYDSIERWQCPFLYSFTLLSEDIVT
jgi:hypothetical protein